jgi:hypothetical protein
MNDVICRYEKLEKVPRKIKVRTKTFLHQLNLLPDIIKQYKLAM